MGAARVESDKQRKHARHVEKRAIAEQEKLMEEYNRETADKSASAFTSSTRQMQRSLAKSMGGTLLTDMTAEPITYRKKTLLGE